MSKPSISNITTTQTFQNWLDKTNEMVDIMRDSVVTASVTGDTTTGDATILGEFTANTITAYDEFFVDDLAARTNGGIIDSASPIRITSAANKVVETYVFAASGPNTRYTNNVLSWDVGPDNNVDFNFLIKQGGSTQFQLSPAGVLTVPSLTVTNEINFPVNANGDVTGVLSAANAVFTDTVTANIINATQINSDDIRGKFTGDVYHPAATGGNGAGKVLENGGPNAAIPATFYGNVNGTVSSLTNHTTNTLNEGTDNRVGESAPGARDGGNNLYFTTTRARNSISGGTGVSYNATSGVVSIGQSVGTSSSVTFAGVNVNGAIVATGDITAFGTISDVTMKENITPIDNALEKVSQLGGYLFNYKGDDRQMTGVMAQELKDVLPGVVYETTDPNDPSNTIYAVRHGNIIGLLIEAIKELQAKVEK